MKPYEKYKPSGVEWIGDIPEGWEVKRLKYIFDIYNGATPKSDNEDYWNGEIVWITPADYFTEMQYISDSRSKITIDGLMSCAARIVPTGSIVISNRAPIGLVAIASVPLCTNQGCKSLVAKTNIDVRYFYYFLSTQQPVLNALGKGTTFLELSSSQLGAFMLPLPNAEIQSTIADFLDYETSKIGAIIKTKEKLIDLLKEKRTSLISHAVTKGLDPNAKMKPSGVEWIGDIPEEWKVKRLKYLFHIYNGATPKSDNEDFWNGEIVWVTPADYSTEIQYINNSRSKITMEGLMSCAARVVPIGSIIISNRAPIGLVAISNVPLCTNQGCKSLISKITADSRYFYYFLSVQHQVLNALGKGTTFLELSSSQLGAFMLPLPNIKVQSNIADYLDRETAQIDAAIEKTKQSIEKLKEYRTALISACVTGKIDIREG